MSAAPSNDASQPGPGLPPVQPPSARFIGQLFVIPGLIILVLVVVFIISNLAVRAQHEPAYFLAKLDSENLDVRWRGASDLAQILKRPESATLRWKADPKFALDITERLEATFVRVKSEEEKIGAAVAASKDKDKHLLWRKLNKERDYLSFLAAALGEFHAPIGAPVLCDILKHDKSPDRNGNTLQRRKALWALMNMGENLKGFAKIPPEQQQNLMNGLKEELGGSSTQRVQNARTALWYLDKDSLPLDIAKKIQKVDETLAVTAEAEDIFLRKFTAMAFNFWDGERAEVILQKLARDTGRGTELRVEEND